VGKSLQRKGIIVILIIILIILGIIGGLLIRFDHDTMYVPEPGYINFSNIDWNNNCSYNHTIRFEENKINVTSCVVDDKTYEELFKISKEYNRSQGDDIWYPLVKGCLKMKGNNPKIDCKCSPQNPLEMIDEFGNVVVHGHFASHKFYIYVEDVYTHIWTSDKNIKKGYEELESFSNILNNDLQYELSKYKDYIYLPENEDTLQENDDQYFAIGGGGMGPHTLLASDFICEGAKGRMESIRLKIRYKTDADYSNENTLKIIYNETIDTGVKLNSSEGEMEVIIDVSDEFDLNEVIIEDISIYYENHGGIISTPVIYFEFTVIEVTTFDP
jgi:hypothetical protein